MLLISGKRSQPDLRPIIVQSEAKNRTCLGAMSSCKVQPRVHQTERRKVLRRCSCIFQVSQGVLARYTSGKYTKHSCDFSYHLYMLLIASESSALERLSIHTVSTQTCLELTLQVSKRLQGLRNTSDCHLLVPTLMCKFAESDDLGVACRQDTSSLDIVLEGRLGWAPTM